MGGNWTLLLIRYDLKHNDELYGLWLKKELRSQSKDAPYNADAVAALLQTTVVQAYLMCNSIAL